MNLRLSGLLIRAQVCILLGGCAAVNRPATNPAAGADPFVLRNRQMSFTQRISGAVSAEWIDSTLLEVNLIFNGEPVGPEGTVGLTRLLDKGRGVGRIRFSAGGEPVEVESFVHPRRDILYVRIKSRLAGRQRIGAELVLPDEAGEAVLLGDFKGRSDFLCGTDGSRFFMGVVYPEKGELRLADARRIYVLGRPGRYTMDFAAAFGPDAVPDRVPSRFRARRECARFWKKVAKEGEAE